MAGCIAVLLLPGKWDKVWTRLNQPSFLTGSQRGISAQQGRRMSHTLVRMRGWWAVEVSSYKRVMGDVRRAQSSTCSLWLFWDIQFPVCQWRDVPCISSEEISTHSLCSGSQPHWCKKKKKTQSKYFQNSRLELMFPNALLKAERLQDCSSRPNRNTFTLK